MDPDATAAELSARGVVSVRVATSSMAPTVRAGDAVLVHTGRPVVGQVALLRTGCNLTLHRIVGRVGPSFRVRWVHAGDAPGAASGLCRDDEVLGVADLPARAPTFSARARFTAIALGRALLWRLRR